VETARHDMRQAPMPIDTSRTIEIKAAPAQMVLAVLIVVAGAAIVLGAIPFLAADEWLQFRGAFLVIVLVGFCAAVWACVVFPWRGPVLTLAPHGIRDIRLAAEFIPWRAVRQISTWDNEGERIMVLAIDPAVERTLTLTRLARWSRAGNRTRGADGLCIGPTGLTIDYDALLDTSLAYMQAHRGG
jgi:hypothetical protein